MRNEKLREVILIATMAAVLEAAKIALNAIQNVELVSLLLMLYAQIFGARRTLVVIYIFDFLETLYWGSGTWVFAYLYVWDVIAQGAFGLGFCFLCAIVTLIIGSPHMMITSWIAGIPYDVIHCISNFTLCMALYQPLKKHSPLLASAIFPSRCRFRHLHFFVPQARHQRPHRLPQ